MANGKRLFRELIEQVWHRGNLSFLRTAYSPSFVGNVPRRELQDLSAYRQYVTAVRAAFPDIRIDVLHQIGEGDFTATRYRVRGTHRGEFMGLEATGREIVVEGTTIQRLTNGRIAESWTNWDVIGMLTDLQATPASFVAVA